MILLDTNALLCFDRRHSRVRELSEAGKHLYVSPPTILELQVLIEAGRLKFLNASLSTSLRHPLWLLDDPPAAAWFDYALEVGWTGDPFDRLLVAHARLRRWKLATSDRQLLDRLPDRERIAI